MPHTTAQGICGDQEAHALCRLDRDGVQACQEFTAGRFQFTPHPVQVHGVRHHGVVVQDDS